MKQSKKPNSDRVNQMLARQELIRSLPKKQGVLSQDSFKGAKLPFVSVKTETKK